MTGLSFSSIYGQPALWQSLKRGFETGSAVHAFLFVGDRGSGKKTAALVCAAAVLCGAEDKPCGQCKSCRQVASGVHPDLLRLGAEGAASIGIAAVRAMQEKLRVRPFEGERRAIVIEDAHLMTQDAQNALLKTLEEPRPGNVLFLLCEQAESLLPTIRSRCRLVRMGRLTKTEMRRALAERGVRADVDPLYESSGGNLGRALEIAADPAYAQMRLRCLRLLEELRSPYGLPETLDSLKDMDRDRALRASFLEAMELLIRQLMRQGLEAGGSGQPLPRRDFTNAQIYCMMEEVVRTRKRLNANLSWSAAVEPLLRQIAGG